MTDDQVIAELQDMHDDAKYGPPMLAAASETLVSEAIARGQGYEAAIVRMAELCLDLPAE